MSDIEPVGALIRGARRRRQARRWEAQTFPTSGGGTLRVPYPSGIAAPPETGGAELFGSAPIGEIIRVSIDHEHHGPGEPLIFNAILDQLGFPDTELPGVEIELPHSAVYGIEGDFSYIPSLHHHGDDEHIHPPFVGGGDVHLLLNGAGIPGLSPIRAGGLPDRSLGKTFTLAQEFVAQKGDLLSIVIDGYSNGEPHIQGVIEVATKEPLRITVTPQLSPLVPDNLGQCNCSSEGDLDALAVYWNPHDTGFGVLEPGDLIVHVVYARPTPFFPTGDGLQIFYSSITPLNGWQLDAPPITRYGTSTIGFDSAEFDHVTWIMSKVITQDDLDWMASNPDAPDSFQEIARVHFTESRLTPGWTVGGQTITMPFRGETDVQVLDRAFDAIENVNVGTLAPWNVTLNAGSGNDLLTSVVYALRSPSIDEVAVDEWETWDTLVLGDHRARVQRALGPQSPRAININSGTPLWVALGVIFKVT